MVISLCMMLAACRHHEEHHHPHPAEVEHIDGSDLSRVTLTDKAMERLDVQTREVMVQSVTRSTEQQKVVPYSAIIYDPQGETWVYTSPSTNTFVRSKVEVNYIEGDLVVLNEGPPEGTLVATVGTSEIYGTEFEVGH